MLSGGNHIKSTDTKGTQVASSDDLNLRQLEPVITYLCFTSRILTTLDRNSGTTGKLSQWQFGLIPNKLQKVKVGSLIQMKELRLPVDFVSFPVGLLQMITAWNMDIEHFISKKERRKTSSSNSQIHSFCLSLCLSGGFSVQAKLPLQ